MNTFKNVKDNSCLSLDDHTFSEMIDPFKEKWINIHDTNCYTYALGIDAALTNLKKRYLNNPGGFIRKDLLLPFTTEELLFNLEGDLTKLNIEFAEVDPDYPINGVNEWKIAVMATREHTRDFSQIYNDFHFLKQTDNGIWTHKKGYRQPPTKLDSLHREITSPIKSIIETDGFYSSDRYEYIKTYGLKKVR